MPSRGQVRPWPCGRRQAIGLCGRSPYFFSISPKGGGAGGLQGQQLFWGQGKKERKKKRDTLFIIANLCVELLLHSGPVAAAAVWHRKEEAVLRCLSFLRSPHFIQGSRAPMGDVAVLSRRCQQGGDRNVWKKIKRIQSWFREAE